MLCGKNPYVRARVLYVPGTRGHGTVGCPHRARPHAGSRLSPRATPRETHVKAGRHGRPIGGHSVRSTIRRGVGATGGGMLDRSSLMIHEHHETLALGERRCHPT